MSVGTGIERALKLRFPERMRNLLRWNGTDYLKSENLSEHSFEALHISRLLSVAIFPGNFEKQLQIADRGSHHDSLEVYTGDLNHNLKHDPEVGAQIRKALEKNEQRCLDRDLPEDSGVCVDFLRKAMSKSSPDVEAVVKIADWICMINFLEREHNRGNAQFFSQIEYCKDNLLKSINRAKIEIGAYNVDFNVSILEDLKKFFGI